jgi:hypothetical protein
MTEFEVIEQFAKNMVDGMTEVDPDIQQIVNDHFLEML